MAWTVAAGRRTSSGSKEWLFGVVARDRLERSRTDGEGQVRNDDAAAADPSQDVVGEVEPGSRGGDGQRLPGEDRLVRLPVLRPVGRARLAPDVGGERNVADLFQERVVDFPVEGDQAAAVVGDAFDLRLEPFGEANGSALLRAASRPGESLPAPGIAAGRAQEEDLDEPALLVPAVEPRVADPHVVAHENVPLREQPGKVREPPVRDGSRPPIQDQQPARASRPRRLSDPVRRKKVIEQVNPHRFALSS